jgi:hypothetical protein
MELMRGVAISALDRICLQMIRGRIRLKISRYPRRLEVGFHMLVMRQGAMQAVRYMRARDSTNGHRSEIVG